MPTYNDDELPGDLIALNVQNCNKINISMVTLQTIPLITIQNVSEVVFHKDSRSIKYGVDRKIKNFSMTKSNTNLIPNGMFKNANYYGISIKKCNIKSIGPRAFHHLKVKNLNIYDTNITQVNSQAFRDVKAEEVFIQDSRLEFVQSEKSRTTKLKDSMFHFLELNYPFNIGMNITIDDSEDPALSVHEMDIQNCNKVNISMMIFHNVPRIVIHNVGEVVFHEDHSNIAVDNSKELFKMSSSKTNLIPNGSFSDGNFSTILIKKCNIKSIQPFAFSNLTVQQLKILDTNITKVSPHAFHDVNANEVLIQNSRFGEVKSNAFHFKDSTNSIIQLSNFTFLDSNALCNIGMKNVTIDHYAELALSVCDEVANINNYENLVLSKECKCNMYKTISLEHDHDVIDTEARSLAKVQAEERILENLNCLWKGHRHSWIEFDNENCTEEHGLKEKITGLLEGNIKTMIGK